MYAEWSSLGDNSSVWDVCDTFIRYSKFKKQMLI